MSLTKRWLEQLPEFNQVDDIDVYPYWNDEQIRYLSSRDNRTLQQKIDDLQPVDREVTEDDLPW